MIAFPEVWIPGHPWFLWLNSLELGSPEFGQLEQAAKDLGLASALGFSEREGGSLYICQAFIDADGVIKSTRRKLKPTHVERMQFGEGDGSDIQVVNTNSFGQLGSFSCWEHLQPLTKYAMFTQGEQLHIAAWPSFSTFEGAVHALGPEVNVGAARQYALKGQTFVSLPAVSSVRVARRLWPIPSKKQFLKLGGHARIIGPDGRDLAEPIPQTEEGILYAEIDYRSIAAAKKPADPVGHYYRPDVFQLIFDSAKKPVLSKGETLPAWLTAPESEEGDEFDNGSRED